MKAFKKNKFYKYFSLILVIAILGLFPHLAWSQAAPVIKEGAKVVIKTVGKQAAKTTPKAMSVATKTGTVIGGSSVILGSRIGNETGYAAHHIIPIELRNHRVLQKISMDLDEARNGISLPRYPGVHPTLPLHSGSHPAYTQAVKTQLDAIPKNLTLKETRQQFNAIQDQFRKKLESGKTLHANAGGKW